MAKAYLIGGVPRAGKTKLALELIGRKPMLAFSTDAMRYTLRRVLAQDSFPDLFRERKFLSGNYESLRIMRDEPEKLIEIQNRESRIVWESVNNFIASNLEDGLDVVVEGVAVLPEFVSKLNYEYEVIFIGNRSEGHIDFVRQNARHNPHDWLGSSNDEMIESFCAFNKVFSQYFADEAAKFDFRYVDITDNVFEKDIQRLAQDIL